MNERAVYTLIGFILLVGTEFMRWLAHAPPEFCTAMTGLAGLAMAGGPSILPRKPPDERGLSRVELLIAILAGVLASLLIGCGSRDVIDSGPGAPTFTIKRGPPCEMILKTSDGERQASVTHATARCRVEVDGKELP